MRRTLISNILLVVFVVAFTGICVAWNWPKWWVNISLEVCALAWLQCSFLLVIGIILLQTAAVRAAPISAPGGRRAPFLDSRAFDMVSGAGFIYLALDERFQFHERMRDYYNFILKGKPVLPLVERGNYTLIVYAIVGLCFSISIIRNNRHLKSVWYFIAGIVTALLAVSMDAITAPDLALADFRREQFIEELLEMTTMTLFLLFYLNRWFFHLDRLTENPKP